MAYFSPEVWVALAGTCGVGIVAILHVLSKRLRRETALHDLRIRTAELRNIYAQRMADMHARENGGSVEVDESGVVAKLEPETAGRERVAA
ncbi:MAG: hypothetical protein K2W85_08000 [Phycisphaerales bacterium]|nr:hypothetical protein [Phycisphaerales bacterium]